MIGVGGQAARHGCEFGEFFSSPPDGTPGDLLQRGIYATIAVAMKGGAWREASMVLLAQAVAAVAAKDDGANGSGAEAAAAKNTNMRTQIAQMRRLNSMTAINSSSGTSSRSRKRGTFRKVKAVTHGSSAGIVVLERGGDLDTCEGGAEQEARDEEAAMESVVLELEQVQSRRSGLG